MSNKEKVDSFGPQLALVVPFRTPRAKYGPVIKYNTLILSLSSAKMPVCAKLYRGPILRSSTLTQYFFLRQTQ